MLTAPLSPARGASISKGSVGHPGGNFCTQLTLATFVSNGDNVILFYYDEDPYQVGSVGIGPSLFEASTAAYYDHPPGLGFVHVSVTTYRDMIPGQQYSITYGACGPTPDEDSYVAFTEACGGAAIEGALSCRWQNGALVPPPLEPPVIGLPLTLLGYSSQRLATLTNTGTSLLSTTVSINCEQFSIVGNPVVSIPAGGSTTFTIRYDPTIEEMAAGEFAPFCNCCQLERANGSLILGTGLGPRLLVATPTQLLRRQLDGSADIVLGAGADHVDFVFANGSEIYNAKWSAGGSADGIYKGALDGYFGRIVATAQPWCVDFDPVDQKVYWAAGGVLRRANTDGSAIETLPIGYPPVSAIDIAIDPYSRQIFWTEVWTQTFIKRANLDGTNPITLAELPGGGNPRLALDRSAGWLYWTENTPGRIRRIRADGTNVQTLLTPGIVSPKSLAVDAAAGTLYWTDSGTQSVHRVALGGENHEELDTGMAGLSGILLLVPPPVEPERIYWTDAQDMVRSVLKNGADPDTVFAGGLVDPRGLAMDATSGKLYWADPGTDKLQCANLDGTGVQDLVTGIQQIQDVALDPLAGKLYWVDSAAPQKIQQADLDGNNVQTLINTGLSGVRGIVVDGAHGRMYWTEVETGGDGIYGANLDGEDVEPLVLGLVFPVGIALDDVGRMYWADYGTGLIERANVDGSSRQTLVSGLVNPRYIELDLGARKMYWTDTGSGKIQRASLDGSGLEDVMTGLSSPVGIAVAVRSGHPTPTGITELPPTPLTVHLDAPRPNPFNPSTAIAYTHAGGILNVSIYDVRGRLVRTLFTGTRAAGDGTIAWNGDDEAGNIVSSGLYYVKMRSNGVDRAAKAVLVR